MDIRVHCKFCRYLYAYLLVMGIITQKTEHSIYKAKPENLVGN